MILTGHFEIAGMGRWDGPAGRFYPFDLRRDFGQGSRQKGSLKL
jgi:hypothetical protein